MIYPKFLISSNPTCRMSDPAQPHKLCRRRSAPPLSMCFSCKGTHLERSKYYYYCATCNLEFHRGCHIISREIKHPFHPSHPLTFISFHPNNHISEILELRNRENCSSSDSEKEEPTWDYNDEFDDDDDDDDSDIDHDKDNHTLRAGTYQTCKCCRRPLEESYYYCSVCNFKLNYSCSGNTVPFTITHPKSHDHTLTLFSKRISFPCDACGLSLDDVEDLVYACVPCGYMTHRSCIDLPRVIKITRHQHRLSHTLSLPSGDFSCGVCRQTVDVNYGQYSCKKGCLYAVHSRCATRNDVWDGKDLEDVPEEFDEDGDIEPFMRIDEETIKHFSHDHYLRLHQNDSRVHRDGTKFCEACCLPVIPSKAFYSCMQCDFVLDEACACLTRKKYHPLHKHPLILYPYHSEPYMFGSKLPFRGIFVCGSFYWQKNCGFVYKCDEKGCKYLLDVKCASLPDPSIHESHPPDHPLFFNMTKGKCMACKERCSKDYLECMKCKCFLGLQCATLPSVVHYKHDRHPLTLNYGKKGTTNLNCWCEICESRLDGSKRFYTCDPCGVTLHVKCVLCLLWRNEYAKPNHIITVGDEEFKIVRNGGNSRPFCDNCALRTAGTLVYRWRGRVCCSFDCMISTFLRQRDDKNKNC